MFLDKPTIRQLIEQPQEGVKPLIEGYDNLTEQVQANGFDLRLDWVQELCQYKEHLNMGKINADNTKEMPEFKIVEPTRIGNFHLGGVGGYMGLTGVYKVGFMETVNLPKNLMAIARLRSTMFRFGCVTLGDGFWDKGYEGKGEALLVVHNPDGLIIERGTRIVQLAFAQVLNTDNDGYDGSYQRNKHLEPKRGAGVAFL